MIAEVTAQAGGALVPREVGLTFACGALYLIRSEPPAHPSGRLKRLLVFVAGDAKVKPPELDGRAMNCLVGCPAKQKESGRVEQQAWASEKAQEAKGEPVWCVLCRPVGVVLMGKVVGP